MKKLCMIALMGVLLTGCGRMQLEDRLLVISMGLEHLPSGELQISVQVPTASQGDAASSGGGYMVISASGEDWEAAMDALEEATPHILHFSQLRQVIFHEKLASGDRFVPLIKQVFRRHQVRSNAYVIVTSDSCKTLLEKQKPDVGSHLGKYLDTAMKNLVAKQYVPQATLGLVVRDLTGGRMDPPLIWGGIQGDKVQFLGAGLTSQGRFVGRLTGHETQLLALLKGGGKRVNIRTENGKNAEVSAFRGAAVKLREDGSLQVTLRATAYASVAQPPSKDEVEKALEKEVAALIEKLQASASDGAGFSRQRLWGTATLQEVQKDPWHFASAQVEVQADVQMVISSH